jgi:hypothetical protein
MAVVALILLALALACFLIAAFWAPPSPPRVNFVALGLAFWVLTALIAGHPH